jgi:hypothetical protein
MLRRSKCSTSLQISVVNHVSNRGINYVPTGRHLKQYGYLRILYSMDIKMESHHTEEPEAILPMETACSRIPTMVRPTKEPEAIIPMEIVSTVSAPLPPRSGCAAELQTAQNPCICEGVQERGTRPGISHYRRKMKISQRGRSHALMSLFPQQEPKQETKSLERLIQLTFR